MTRSGWRELMGGRSSRCAGLVERVLIDQGASLGLVTIVRASNKLPVVSGHASTRSPRMAGRSEPRLPVFQTRSAGLKPPKRRCFPRFPGSEPYHRLSRACIMCACPKLPRSSRLSRARSRPLPSPPVRGSRCRRPKRRLPPSRPPEHWRRKRRNFSNCGLKQ